jgi:hypothetical protein
MPDTRLPLAVGTARIRRTLDSAPPLGDDSGVDHLPAAPRAFRRSTALAAFWPLGVASCATLLCSLLLVVTILSRDAFRLPSLDWRLDAAAKVETVRAQIEHVPAKGTDGGRYTFTFTTKDGNSMRGVSWGPTGLLVVGEGAAVEYLPQAPEIHRLRGMHGTLLASWLPKFAGWLLLPALLGVGFWLARGYQNALLLRDGRATLPTEVHRTSLPIGSRAVFSWRSTEGPQTSSQYLPPGSPIAQQAATGAADTVGLFVVFDPDRPSRHRLVARSEFREASA